VDVILSSKSLTRPLFAMAVCQRPGATVSAIAQAYHGWSDQADLYGPHTPVQRTGKQIRFTSLRIVTLLLWVFALVIHSVAIVAHFPSIHDVRSLKGFI